MNKVTDERLVEIRQKVREEIIRSAAILRPKELALTVDDVLEFALRAQGGVASLEASPAPVSELSGQDLQLLDRLKRDNVWDGSRPVLERSRTDPDTEQAFRLSEQGYIALEQVALGIRLHITRKGVSALDSALTAKGGQ